MPTLSLPPIQVLATAAADLVLQAADEDNTSRVNALNKAVLHLHSGIQITLTVGGALIPSIAGFVAQSAGIATIPVFMVVMAIMLVFLEGAFRLRADHPDHRATLESA